MGGPVLLVTGGSRGIGAATVVHARRAGYRVVNVSRHAAQDATDDDGVLAVQADVQSWTSVQSACARAVDVFGRLDAVFANAGVSLHSSFVRGEPDTDAWQEMVLTNVLGTALTARAAMPYLIESTGHLLITGSVAGTVVVPGDLYSATKWAVSAIGRSIRAEASPVGVRVTLVQPGLVSSGERGPDRTNDPALTPDDVARTVMFALSQPAHVDVGELVVRPIGQSPHR